jgi:hypothetical protein
MTLDCKDYNFLEDKNMQYRLKIASLLCALLPFTGMSANIHHQGAHAQQDSISVTTNEGRAIKSLRAILDAETTYQRTVGNGEYGDLKQLHAAGLIDKTLESGTKDGYSFLIAVKKSTLTSPPSVDLVARPIEYGKGGRRSFYLTEAGTLLTSEAKDAPLSEMRPFAGGKVEPKTSASQANDLPSIDSSDNEPTANDISANEAAAINILRAIHAAQTLYKTKVGAGEYGTLEQLEKQRLLNKDQIASVQDGYLFEVTVQKSRPNSPATYSIYAVPQSYGVSGRRAFYIDHTGVLRGADKEGGPADATDPPIEASPK